MKSRATEVERDEVQDHMDKQEDERTAPHPQQRLSQAEDLGQSGVFCLWVPQYTHWVVRWQVGGGCHYVLGILFMESVCGIYVLRLTSWVWFS